MSSIQFLSKVTLEMTNRPERLCSRSPQYVCVWWDGWHISVQAGISRGSPWLLSALLVLRGFALLERACRVSIFSCCLIWIRVRIVDVRISAGISEFVSAQKIHVDWLVLYNLIPRGGSVCGAKACLDIVCRGFRGTPRLFGSPVRMLSSHSLACAHDNDPRLSMWVTSPITNCFYGCHPTLAHAVC